MEEITKIASYTEELLKVADKHPCNEHGKDHDDIRKAIRLIGNTLKEIENARVDQKIINTEIYENIGNISDGMKNAWSSMWAQYLEIEKLHKLMAWLMSKFPKITTMQKSALIMNGENVLDTVEIESGRYLLVKSITPSDRNEYAKLDKTFSWEIIEVTDNKYDVVINLDTNTEWETATMTVNVDLLFVKF